MTGYVKNNRVTTNWASRCIPIHNFALVLLFNNFLSVFFFLRKIPEFVPCVEANKADYMMLLDCDMQVRAFLNMLTTSADISRDQLWDLTIESFNRANDIICSRTDGISSLYSLCEK